MNSTHGRQAIEFLCDKNFFTLAGYMFEMCDDDRFRVVEKDPSYLWQHYPRDKVEKAFGYAIKFGLTKHIIRFV